MKPLLLTAVIFLFPIPCLNAQDTTANLTADTARTMQKVTVKTAKPFIDNRADRTVMNIDATGTMLGMNGLELLRQAPGVVVDASENIQIGGKTGVTVYIDDKPANLNGQDLAQLLKTIDASNIKEIEIYQNPPARYEASGNAGIINIKLKRSLNNGFNGTIASSYSQSNHGRGTASAQLNLRHDKWNVFMTTNANAGLQHVTALNNGTTPNYVFSQQSRERDEFNGSLIRTGIDYHLNKKNTLGLLWMHNNKYTGMDNASLSVTTAGNGMDTAIGTRSIAPFHTRRNNFNVNYNYHHKSTLLNIDGDYARYQSSLRNDLVNQYAGDNGHNVATESRLYDQNVMIRIKSFRADLAIHPDEGWKLDAGLRILQTQTVNSLNVSGLILNTWVSDTGKTNDFQLSEDILAVYGSVNRQWSKFSLQMGARFEFTNTSGWLVDLKGREDHVPDTSYLNIFPTLFLNYKFNPRHQLSFSLVRRIDRPTYQDQNPFIYALDALNSEQGNPYLKPQFTTSVEAGYTYKYASSVRIKYSVTSDYFEQLTYQVQKGTVMIPQNTGTRRMINIVIGTPVRIANWWDVYTYAEPYYQSYTVLLQWSGRNERQEHGSWGFNSYLGQSFTLFEKWKADLNGWFNFQNHTTIYISKPIGSLSLSVQRSFAKENFTAKLVVNDLFNTQRWQQDVKTQTIQMTTYRKWESRNLTLGLTWRFGNRKIKASRDRISGAEEVEGRIKS